MRANQATLDLLGKQWPEVEGKQDIEILDDLYQARLVMANDRTIMDTGVPQALEEIIDHPDKGPRVFLSTKVPIDNVIEGIDGIVGLSVDITDRKAVNEQILHVARRTAMGDMAASIAHEINQPLAAIAMYLAGSKALLEKDSYPGPVIQSLAMAKDQCLRAGEIIRRVRHFVSGDSDEKQAESISFLINEACALALIDPNENNVVVTIKHCDTDIIVMAHRVQIEQVVVNLIRNATDAMTDVSSPTLLITSAYLGDMTLVSVSDNGPGISGDIVDCLFQPFVSTKGAKGMGVGLSLCRTIIESHGGKIWVEPNGGQGATFRFTLPTLNREINV